MAGKKTCGICRKYIAKGDTVMHCTEGKSYHVHCIVCYKCNILMMCAEIQDAFGDEQQREAIRQEARIRHANGKHPHCHTQIDAQDEPQQLAATG